MRISLILLLLLVACRDVAAPSAALPGRYELAPVSAYTAGYFDLAADGTYTTQLTATVDFVHVIASNHGTYSVEADSIALLPARDGARIERIGYAKGRLQRALAGLLLTYEKR